MADDFSYLNARIRGMRGRLLGAGEIRDLAGERNLEAVVERLRSTPYGPYIESSLTGREGLDAVDEGLTRSLSSSFEKIVRIADGRPRELIVIAVGWWEMNCVKTVLRSRGRQAGAEETLAAAVPAGMMTAAAIRELARQPDVGAVIDLLRLWGYPPASRLRKAWKSLAGGADLQLLEQILDSAFLETARAAPAMRTAEGAALRSLMREMTDVVNIVTALRLLHSRSPALSSDLLPWLDGGGRFTKRLFVETLSKRDVTAAVAFLDWIPAASRFSGILPEYRRTGRLSLFDRAARQHLSIESARASRLDSLGIGVALGYLRAKAAEVGDLRLLCRALHQGIPRSLLSGELSETPA